MLGLIFNIASINAGVLDLVLCQPCVGELFSEIEDEWETMAAVS